MIWLLLCPCTEDILCVQSSQAARCVGTGEGSGRAPQKHSPTAAGRAISALAVFALEEVSVESVTVLQPHPGSGGGCGCQQSHAGFNHTRPVQAASLSTLRKAIYRCQNTELQTGLANLMRSFSGFCAVGISLYMSDAWECFGAVDGGRITQFPHSKLLRN